jgi:hypothetical protein
MITYEAENSGLGCEDAAWEGETWRGGAAAPGSRVQWEAKSMDNEYFQWKLFMFCAQKTSNFLTKEMEIQQIIVT